MKKRTPIRLRLRRMQELPMCISTAAPSLRGAFFRRVRDHPHRPVAWIRDWEMGVIRQSRMVASYLADWYKLYNRVSSYTAGVDSMRLAHGHRHAERLEAVERRRLSETRRVRGRRGVRRSVAAAVHSGVK